MRTAFLILLLLKLSGCSFLEIEKRRISPSNNIAESKHYNVFQAEYTLLEKNDLYSMNLSIDEVWIEKAYSYYQDSLTTVEIFHFIITHNNEFAFDERGEFENVIFESEYGLIRQNRSNQVFNYFETNKAWKDKITIGILEVGPLDGVTTCLGEFTLQKR